MKTYASIIFGLFMIWTGLHRSIEAQAFKPNAFWFCFVMGLIAIVGGYLIRLRIAGGLILTSVAATVSASFYIRCLMIQPEKDANVRVALAIVASLGVLSLLWLPPSLSNRESEFNHPPSNP